MTLDLDKINDLVDAGYISKRLHPTLPLSIYNYTPQCQFEWHWTPETIACRGLILHDEGGVVARPFPKFFTPDQYRDLRNNVHHLYGVRYRDMYKGGFTVTEKMDGSMGILYTWEDKRYMASRGSFESPQALKGTEILQQRYADYNFAKGVTYLFEIIYPENRIVVNYGEREDIVLLAVLDNDTGLDCPDLVQQWRDEGYPAAEQYEFSQFADVLEVQADEGEGFVVKFDNGIRVKVKFEEYLRLHKIMTNITARTIWEYLRDHKQLQEILDFVPDEFYKWVVQAEDDLLDQFRAIEEEAKNGVKACAAMGWIPDNRKAIATHFKPGPIRGIMFQMIDGKNYEDTIWKMIKPKADRPGNQ